MTIASHPLATAGSVLYAINEKDGFDMWDMRLIYGRIQLDRDRFLRDYDVQRGSTVHVVPRMCGGGFIETELLFLNHF